MEESFPVYLRLLDGKSYYKVLSLDEMTEYQRIGKRWLRHDVKATILPERYLILDLLGESGYEVERISENQFRKAINDIEGE